MPLTRRQGVVKIHSRLPRPISNDESEGKNSYTNNRTEATLRWLHTNFGNMENSWIRFKILPGILTNTLSIRNYPWIWRQYRCHGNNGDSIWPAFYKFTHFPRKQVWLPPFLFHKTFSYEKMKNFNKLEKPLWSQKICITKNHVLYFLRISSLQNFLKFA